MSLRSIDNEDITCLEIVKVCRAHTRAYTQTVFTQLKYLQPTHNNSNFLLTLSHTHVLTLSKAWKVSSDASPDRVRLQVLHLLKVYVN